MIWYSHVNEDNRIERTIARGRTFRRAFCIAGSGERVISLLGLPSLPAVHAIDLNDDAIRLLDLKLSALRQLSVDEYLRFCGFADDEPESRARLWHAIKDDLGPETRAFWNGLEPLVRRGIANIGHFEQWLTGIRPIVRTYLGRGFEECWTHPPGQYRHFPWRRWRLLMRTFSLRIVYRLSGNRDPAFVGAGAHAESVSDALEHTLRHHRVPDSFMWHLIFRGHIREMNPDAMPPSVRPDVLRRCRESIAAGETTVHLQTGDLLTVLRTLDADDLSDAFFSLSDLLSFADFSYLLDLIDLLAGSNSTLVIRSFLRNPLTPDQLRQLEEYCRRVVDWSDRESTGMYRVHELRL